jgi:tyrosyl-tRNA synthetase
VKGGAVRVNDEVVSDDRLMLTREAMTSEGVIKLSLGRKRHALLKME